ncbi:TonB-dependent receptor [Thalassotalea sp. LPB0316]|uniref:TonB-dependent receptor n=1 Tax=Thalassotalea sp. LPB0316 TaxID=2769490 RepID=UPI00186959FC|nr:TonB-dependent receptor [Thalassotalea sp. LPB0316]QOL26830.1 TonB-dependent receptor [Thalassotalea sp. LPB0316]
MTTIIQSPTAQGRLKKSLLAQVIISAISLSSVSALAAEQADEKNDDTDIEVMTVTAQKRVQNILKVPVTVASVSQETIEKTTSILLSDIDVFIPGFEFSDGNMTQAGVTMRGISSPNISVGGDPSTAIFYDDVYMPRAAQNVLFSDMARVEVLKGPQGTLFGRNAAMGVVNMVPNSPHDEFEGFVKGTFGTDNLARIEGMINLPINDNVYVRANLLTNEQDGIVENVAEPSWAKNESLWDLGARDHNAARIALFWQVSDKTDFQLSYDWDDLEQAPPMAVGISEYAYKNGKEPFGNKAENDVYKGVESRDMYGVTAKLNHEFNDQWSMKYVLSYRDWQTVNREDEDGTADPTRYFDTSNNEDSNILYSELQFNYVSNKLNAVAGMSYSKEDVSQTTELNLTADTAARLVTGDLNNFIEAGVASQIAAMIGGNSDAHAEAAFGPGATFDMVVQGFMADAGLPLEHLWNADEWANALNVLGYGADIMAAIGMPGQPLSADIVNLTGDLTYDIVAAELGIAEVFGPSFAGEFWQESVNNTGKFTNWGIFADVDYAVTDKWNVIAGVRYSQDDKDFTWYIPETQFAAVRPGVGNIIFPMVDLAASDSWDKITGRLVTSYQVTDKDMVFASYSTGYKSGGFDSLVPSEVAFEPEDTENFEVGYKGIISDSLVANVSAYYLTLTNQQQSVSSKEPGDVAAVPRIINIDKDITGLEFDLRWTITPTVSVGVVSEIRSTDTKRPAYYNAEGTLIEAQTTSQDAALNYTLSFDWLPDLGVGTTAFHMNYVFVENLNADDPGLEEYAKGVPEYFEDIQDLNMRLSWINDKDNLELGVWGKNLLDNDYMLSLGGLTADLLGTPFGRINRGLEAGIDIKYSF